MERLTTKNLEFVGVKKVGDMLCGNVCKMNTCDNCPIEKSFEKLAYYEDLEEQGLLVKLPCMVGDVVYSVEFRDSGEIVEEKVISFQITKDHIFVYGECDRFIGGLGKTVFGTREEAEAKLKEIQ